MITEAFNIYQANYRNEIPSKETVHELIKLGYNKGSAGIIVNHIFPNLLAGKVFKRTLSYADFADLISYLASTMSDQEFILVCESLWLHLTYRKHKVNIANLQRILNEITVERIGIRLSKELLDEKKELISTELIIQDQTRKDRIELLNSLTAFPNQSKVKYQGKAYRRDLLAIALIKSLREPRCQICGKQISKKNGGFYIEAAHLVPKRAGGSEHPNNIVLLCPNHHKEFDLGDSTWQLNGNRVVITLNGVSQNEISLEII